jgi:hypothetical protein
MKIENKKMKRMEALFRKVRKGGLNPAELNELKDLSSYFLFIAVASDYTLAPSK